ncbi:MAG: ubiquitin-like domain-containing protein [Oscillospiraceae bacterium]|nr:ubiquitin-like domain-containing protein [Oscillospiraceae bacterium]
MKPQIVNAKMNRLLFRDKVIKVCIFAAIVFSVVMMTGYRGFKRSVFITDNGITKEIKTNESDIYEILADENYELGEEDRVSYAKDENNEGHITIQRAFTVNVKVDGETRRVTMVKGTVADILAKAEVTLGEYDEVKPALDTETTEDMIINITRVRYSQRTVVQDIPFETEFVDDPDLAYGNETVLTEGENGMLVSKIKDTYINGKLVRSETLSETVEKQPVNEVIERGVALATPYNNNTPDTVKLVNGLPESYTRIITGKSTAYSARAGARTASGRYAVVGTVAVNPNVIPYGSELYIVSHDGLVYGYAIAADTGLGMMEGTVLVDLFMASYQDSCRWGAHTVDIYVLSEGHG